MRQKCIVPLAVVAALLLGCASGPDVQDRTARPRRMKKAKPMGWAQGQVQGDDSAMGMEMSLGVLDERAVDRAIKPHERVAGNDRPCFKPLITNCHNGSAMKGAASKADKRTGKRPMR